MFIFLLKNWLKILEKGCQTWLSFASIFVIYFNALIQNIWFLQPLNDFVMYLFILMSILFYVFQFIL